MHPVLLSGSPILDVDATFVFYILVFLVLMLILRNWVFTPVMDLFDERERAVGGAKKEAKKVEKEAEEKLRRFESELAKVREEAGEEKERLRAEGVRLERKLTDKVRAETEKMVSDADAELSKEAQALRVKIQAETPVLAREIAEKLLGRKVS